MKTIRIAAGSGFWGDWQQAPINQVRLGPINYLVLDYLAELTMSVLAKQYEKSPALGYAHDFVDLIAEILPDLVSKNIKVICNAGGVNPLGCAQAIRAIAERLGFSDKVKVAVVTGDNITTEIQTLVDSGEKFLNLDNGRSISEVQKSLVSANAYLGSKPLVEALKTGANIVISGRVSDAALALAPMIYEFDWAFDDWDRLALGTVAGHLIECGAQCSGGNCSINWQSIPDLANIGYPIIEISTDGTCIITKHKNTGGRVDLTTVKEQLVYEIGDPKEYITPDVVADFTSVKLKDLGSDRVQISGVKGLAATDKFKVSACYSNGFKAENSLIYTWPDAKAKARVAEQIFRKRIEKLKLDEILIEHVGLNSCHGNLVDLEQQEPNEILLRVSARAKDREQVKEFSKQLVPLVLSGPPSVSGYTSGGKVSEVYSYWPTLVSKSAINSRVKVELV